MVGASEDVWKRKKDIWAVGGVLEDAWEWNEDISDWICEKDISEVVGALENTWELNEHILELVCVLDDVW